MIYKSIEYTLFGAGINDEYNVRAVEKPDEMKALLAEGFEYVCQKDNLVFLRKRK